MLYAYVDPQQVAPTEVLGDRIGRTRDLDRGRDVDLVTDRVDTVIGRQRGCFVKGAGSVDVEQRDIRTRGGEAGGDGATESGRATRHHRRANRHRPTSIIET
jgi:hypothetical protein